MIYIDSVVLDLTERCCRTFQRLTGRTNVWLAVQLTNVSIIVYFVWAAIYFWTSEGTPRIYVAVFCTGLLIVLSQTILRVPVETYEKSAYRRVAGGLRNPRRVQDAMLRVMFLTLSIVLAYPILFIHLYLRAPAAVLSYPLVVLTTVVLYLLACDPLPPCAGKVREWVRGLRPQSAQATRASSAGWTKTTKAA